MLRAPVWLLVVLALLVAACGDGDAESTTTTAGGGDDQETSTTADDTSTTAVEPSGETVEWDFTVVAGPTSDPSEAAIGNLLQEFADRVEAETNGALRITLRAPGELPYGLDEQLTTAGANRVQVADIGVFAAGESPPMGAFGLPFLMTTLDEFMTAMDVMSPYLESEWERYGVEPIFFYSWPSQTTWGSGEGPDSLEDLAGRTLRVSSPAQGHLFEELGTETVTLATGEVATALQQNLVEGVVTAAYNAYPLGWGESLDWGYMTSLGYVPGIIVVNSEAMAELPADVQETVRQIGAEIGEKMLQVIPEAEDESRQLMVENNGLTLIPGEPSDSELGLEIMAPYWEEWGANNGLGEMIDALREEFGR